MKLLRVLGECDDTDHRDAAIFKAGQRIPLLLQIDNPPDQTGRDPFPRNEQRDTGRVEGQVL